MFSYDLQQKNRRTCFLSVRYRVTRASGSDTVVKTIGGTPLPYVALIRGIPFSGVDPVVKKLGVPPYRNLDKRYTIFWR